MKSYLQKATLWVMGLLLAIALQSQSLPAYSIYSPDAPVGDRAPGSETVDARVSEIEQTWQAQYSAYFDLTSPTPPLTAEQITQTLSRLTTETGQHYDKLELMLVIPGEEVLRYALPDAALPSLMETVNTFQAEVARPVAVQTYLTSARQLYRWLIAPLERQLQAKTIDTLIFCLGPGLRSLPLAALYDGQQFLIEKYSLGLIPAFSLTQPNHLNLHNTQVLAMGASEFANLEDLPAVPIELSAITQNLWQGQVFLNQDFTLDNLRQELDTKQFSIVHLATHANFQPGTPDRSFIQFWQTEQLNLQDVRQLNWQELPVELLVLSACQTALGDRDAELGFAGLSFHA
jgi:CHAT domain-containing protein